ncbi:MAG: FmdB family transcriptional regulator [Chloroflexi bacterium]|nr:FmdB family transcriptional regulator [Chloroflexota bacterium]
MPIYTYECQSCDSTLEKRQSFSDDPLTVHESCGGSLRRVIHPAGIVFKGSGFYNTDYKSSTGSNGSSDAAATKTESTSSDASSSAPAASSSGDSSSSAAASTPSSAPAAAAAPSTP